MKTNNLKPIHKDRLTLTNFNFALISENAFLSSHGSQGAYMRQFKEKAELYETKYKDLVHNFNLMKNFLEDLEQFYFELFKTFHSR